MAKGDNFSHFCLACDDQSQKARHRICFSSDNDGIDVNLSFCIDLCVSESLNARPTKLGPLILQRYCILMHYSDAEWSSDFDCFLINIKFSVQLDY